MRIEFDVTVTTPMFIGGHDSKQLNDCGEADAQQLLAAEGLRVPSLRGAMRFWFRALAGRITADLKAIQKAESRVFGGTSEPASRSAVRVQSWPLEEIQIGQYAVRMNQPKRPMRWAIAPKTHFGLALSSRHPHLLKVALGCLWMVANFGGVGARTRRGFGGIQVVEIENQNSVLAKHISFKTQVPDAIQRTLGLLLKKNANPQQDVVEGLAQSLNLSRTINVIASHVHDLVETPAGQASFSTIGESHIIWPNKFEDGDLLGWSNWPDALERARRDVYNPFKEALCLAHIGNPVAPKAANNRQAGGKSRYASPLCLKVIPFSQAGKARYAILATMLENNWATQVNLNCFLNQRAAAKEFVGNANRPLIEYWRSYLDSATQLNGSCINANGLEAWSVL